MFFAVGSPAPVNNIPSTFVYHFDGADLFTGPFVEASGVGQSFRQVAASATLLTTGTKKFGTAAVTTQNVFPGGVFCQVDADPNNAANPAVEPFYPEWLSPFTIDFFVYFNSLPVAGTPGIYNNGRIGVLDFSVNLALVSASSVMRLQIASGAVDTFTYPFASISTGAWHHIAFISTEDGLAGGNFYWTFDGAVIGTMVSKTGGRFGRCDGGNNGVRMGYNDFGNPGASQVLDGVIDEVHCLVGQAAWTSFPFTPPAAPYLPA